MNSYKELISFIFFIILSNMCFYGFDDLNKAYTLYARFSDINIYLILKGSLLMLLSFKAMIVLVDINKIKDGIKSK